MRLLRRAVVGGALVLAVTGGGGPSMAAPTGPTYTLMQMNLCLSGFARCYGKVAYPAGAAAAVARIREAHPDAVTVNEACRGATRWYPRHPSPQGRRRSDRAADGLPPALLGGALLGRAVGVGPDMRA